MTMKTYEEMAASALERIGAERKKRRRRQAVMAPMLCLIVLAGAWGVAHGVGRGDVPGPADTGIGTSAGETADRGEDRIVINTMDAETETGRWMMNISLGSEDFVPMTTEELAAYYGTDPFPTVPSDLENWDQAEDFPGYGIFRADGGQGEPYWDQVVLNYSNDDFTRSVNVEVAKGRLPFVCFGLEEADEQVSLINGVEVYLGVTASGYYRAQMMYNGVGFLFTMEGLTQEEAVEVVRSVLD